MNKKTSAILIIFGLVLMVKTWLYAIAIHEGCEFNADMIKLTIELGIAWLVAIIMLLHWISKCI